MRRRRPGASSVITSAAPATSSVTCCAARPHLTRRAVRARDRCRVGQGPSMKILLLNPNTTASMPELMLAAGRQDTAAGTKLVPLTASRGVPYIATRAEAQIGGAITLEMLAE